MRRLPLLFVGLLAVGGPVAFGQAAVEIPTWLGWPSAAPRLAIQRDSTGQFRGLLDWATLRSPSQPSYYVDPLRGDDSNPGTRASALRTLSAALSKTGVRTVILRKGVYYNSEGFDNAFLRKSLNIQAAEGEQVVLGSHEPMAWSRMPGYVHVWRAQLPGSASQVGRVYDIEAPRDAMGLPTPMPCLPNPALVDRSPASWGRSGRWLYVHRFGERTPDRNLVPALSEGGGIRIGRAPSVRAYLRRINAVGGKHALLAATEARWQRVSVAVDGGWFVGGARASDRTDVIQAQGASLVLQAVRVAYGAKDGINLHAKDGNVGTLVELDCTSYRNGLPPNRSCNGSTVHDGIKAIRIRSAYFENRGANLADIDPGTASFNLGIDAHHSLTDGTVLSRIDYAALPGVRMYLEGCRSWGSSRSLFAAPDAWVRLKYNLFPNL